MLSRYLFKLYQRYVGNRRRSRNLACRFLFLVAFAILRQVAFIFRRNYNRTFNLDDWFRPIQSQRRIPSKSLVSENKSTEAWLVDLPSTQELASNTVCAFLIIVSILILAKVAVQGFFLYHHDVNSWPSRTTTLCGGNFTGYARLAFRMKSAVYDPVSGQFWLGCEGGHLPPRYLMFMRLCRGSGKYRSRIGHMTEAPHCVERRKAGITVIVDRANPHNYYHAMQDWYNLFLISKFFKFDFRETRLFLIDNNPPFHIDNHWDELFPKLTYVSNLKAPMLLEDAIFGIDGPRNPMSFWELEELQYVEEFSKAFLSSFNLKSNKTLDCKHLTITLYIRRDYFLHPDKDSTKRSIERKYKHEEELMATLERHFGGEHTMRTLIAEDMSLKEQLRLATDTDILAGMHGCALTNVLFMPRHAAIFEMYPNYWNVQNFFRALADWRGIPVLEK